MSKRLGGIIGCKYKTSSVLFRYVFLFVFVFDFALVGAL